jgi:hypothetical protein
MYLRLINLKRKEFVFNGSKNSNRTDPIAEKSHFLRKLDFFVFVSGSLPGWPYAIVVCCPLSSFHLKVRHLILPAVIIRRCHRLPLLLFAFSVVVHCRHHCLPPPSSAAAAIIATLLSPPSLAALFCPSPS